jgi:hypothetical protein
VQPEKHEDRKPADERNEKNTVRLSVGRAAQTIQKLEEEECRGEQHERGYIIAEGSVLGVTVILGLRSASLKVMWGRSYARTHHFAAKQPPWRKFSLIIGIIMVFSYIPLVKTRSWQNTSSTHAS